MSNGQIHLVAATARSWAYAFSVRGAMSPTALSPIKTCARRTASIPSGSSTGRASTNVGSRCLTRRPATFVSQAADSLPEIGRREPADVDLLVVATFTPDMAFPSTANLIQDRLKLNCPAFDVQAACAGFVFALVIGGPVRGHGEQPVRPGDRRRLQ